MTTTASLLPSVTEAVNEAAAMLAEGKRNIVLVGGTGTGKTHLAVAIARSCIRKGARGRCYNVVDLVNHLEAELRAGRQGRTADQLVRRDFVILDELGYLNACRGGAGQQDGAHTPCRRFQTAAFMAQAPTERAIYS